MKHKKYLLTTLFCLSTSVFAASERYAIYIDAGSTSSKMHLYQYIQEDNKTNIKEIFSEKVKPGLSEYAEHPDNAPQSLKKALDDAVIQLQKLNVNEQGVALNILATAGMRLLTKEQQQAIYSAIKKDIEANYHFGNSVIETISGKMEGLYDWIDLNYLEGNFDLDKATLGAIDMGGASTQIAFETRDTSKLEGEVQFRYGNKIYHVFSKSFLGLGINKALFAMTQTENSGACFPTDSSAPRHSFNQNICGDVYLSIINQYKIPEQLISFKDTHFALFSGAYYVYNFFGVEDGSQLALDSRIKNICRMTWDEMKQEYKDSNIPEDMLISYCANGVYLSKLFYDTYHLTWQQIWVTEKAHNKQPIDWTVGALLYDVNTKVG
jgi:apyrase